MKMVVRSSISSLVLKEKTHIEYWEFFVIEYLIRHTLACRKLCTVTNLLIKEKTMVITLNGNCQCYQLYLFLMPQKIVKNLMFAFAFQIFSNFNIKLIFFSFSRLGLAQGPQIPAAAGGPLTPLSSEFRLLVSGLINFPTTEAWPHLCTNQSRPSTPPNFEQIHLKTIMMSSKRLEGENYFGEFFH